MQTGLGGEWVTLKSSITYTRFKKMESINAIIPFYALSGFHHTYIHYYEDGNWNLDSTRWTFVSLIAADHLRNWKNSPKNEGGRKIPLWAITFNCENRTFSHLVHCVPIVPPNDLLRTNVFKGSSPGRNKNLFLHSRYIVNRFINSISSVESQEANLVQTLVNYITSVTHQKLVNMIWRRLIESWSIK